MVGRVLQDIGSAAPLSPVANRGEGKLSSSAREFESILLGQWLQDAENSFGKAPGAAEDDDAGSDQMNSFGTQQLAKELVAKGGVGIAKLVQSALEKTGSSQPVALPGAEIMQHLRQGYTPSIAKGGEQ